MIRGVTMHQGLPTFEYKKFLIVDPQPVFRMGLVSLLEKAHPHWEVDEADTLEEYKSRLRARSIDVLILAARLLGTELGTNGTAHIRANLANHIIAVTDPGDSIGAMGCLAAGAHTTISRSDAPDRMLTTIEATLARRQPPIGPALSPLAPKSSEVLSLTTRQLDVLRLLAKGHSNKVIARDLGLSVSTVKVHLNTVFRALGASNRVEAVVRGRQLQPQMAVNNH